MSLFFVTSTDTLAATPHLNIALIELLGALAQTQFEASPSLLLLSRSKYAVPLNDFDSYLVCVQVLSLNARVLTCHHQHKPPSSTISLNVFACKLEMFTVSLD